MKNDERKKSENDATKIFRIIEVSKDKLLCDDELSDEDFVQGLESLMDKIVGGIKETNGKKEKNKR